MSETYLPEIYLRIRSQLPDVARALDQLGSAADTAGPLDERTQRLVKLAISIGLGSDGAVRSNARRALDVGASQEELMHVVALAVSTGGFPAAVASYGWIEQVLSARDSANAP